MNLDDREFLIGLHVALENFKQEATLEARERGARVLGKAKQRVHVRSGKTRDSLALTEGREGSEVYVEVGTDLPQAVYEDFGTIHMPGSHFMSSSLDEEV
jgi:seryl-tRNA(Sec) selenium transferase